MATPFFPLPPPLSLASDLVSSIRLSGPTHLDTLTSRITRTIRTIKNGLEGELDDDVIRELKEGQDMVLQIEEVEQSPGAKREWETAVDSNDGSPGTQLSDEAGGYVLRLIF
ncbi:hypothetical protein EDB81DRAFT_759368 [Dactylonectria macrodidyma]|uniref:Uncharacterized protein n=1 Tax=Dactylonectria macrodidyma TaxID=307937 RepID=A0A9P9EWS2_9HYPO|nr:hypothetical protein EDB81DRAFT_759368 [Dactylonectria macrodidyma]